MSVSTVVSPVPAPAEEQPRFTHADFVSYLKEIDDNAKSPVRAYATLNNNDDNEVYMRRR